MIGDKSSSFYYGCLVDFYYFKNNSKTTLKRVVLGFAALAIGNSWFFYISITAVGWQ